MANELLERIEHSFTFHAPSSDDVAKLHEEVRAECKKLAQFVASRIPDSRELSNALTSIEAAMHWANSGVALHQDSLPTPASSEEPTDSASTAPVAESPDNAPTEDVTTQPENTEQG